jgi:hypothetical protein
LYVKKINNDIMKPVIISFIISMVLCACSTRPIPVDMKYLGQLPPGNAPQIFEIPLTEKNFTAERIAISNDDKTIYYQELDGYPEMDGKPHTQRIKYFSFSDGKWNGPILLFEGWGSPCLSTTNDTLYTQKGGWSFEAYYSIKSKKGWSTPERFLLSLNRAHYLQVTDSGNYYAASIPRDKIGVIDRCRLTFNGSDTTAITLGSPINTEGYNLDYFISRDESYMIVARGMGGRLSISFRKLDGTWTDPADLGKKINFGLAAWGPYVTRDNKYQFYTTGTRDDYSDTRIFWVKIDNMIDSLKKRSL